MTLYYINLYFHVIIVRVEFMSKFYVGNGHAFQPFWFKHVLENEEAVED